MRFPQVTVRRAATAWSVAALTLILVGCGRAESVKAAFASPMEEPRSNPRDVAEQILRDLVSPDIAVRDAAITRVHDADDGALLRGASRLDDAAWDALAYAVAAKTGSWCAVLCVREAHSATAAHRDRLLALAHRLHPDAGVARTPEEIRRIVRERLTPGTRRLCWTGVDTDLALLGHDAVPALLEWLRDHAERSGSSSAWGALYYLAEREDVPALRSMLLDGRTQVAEVLGILARRGVDEAGDALLDGVSAGHFDGRVAEELDHVRDRERVIAAIRSLLAERDTGEGAFDGRTAAAELLGRLGARDFVPTLERWTETATRSWEFDSFGHALARLGSRKGIWILVQILEQAAIERPCRKPAVLPPPPAGYLCADGFADGDRRSAAEMLASIAGPDVYRTPEGRARDGSDLAAAAVAFRAWWDASRNDLRFDAATGRWATDR